MKNVICSIYLLMCMVSFGQKKTDIKLEWKDTPLLFSDDISVAVPHFQTEYFYYDGSKNAVFFTYSYLTSTENNFEISNIAYENISKEQLGRLESEKLPTEIHKQVSVSKSREDKFLTIEFEPVIREGNTFKRVKSFTLTTSNNGITHKALDTNDA